MRVDQDNDEGRPFSSVPRMLVTPPDPKVPAFDSGKRGGSIRGRSGVDPPLTVTGSRFDDPVRSNRRTSAADL